MAKFLIVDDSMANRRLAGALLEEEPGWQAVLAENGKDALAILAREQIDLVITDLLMPGFDGQELVLAMRRSHPTIPVVLMTRQGSEEIAGQAILLGAASYVPKSDLARDLVPTVASVLGIAQPHRDMRQVLERLTRTEFSFALENDSANLQPVIGHFQDLMSQLKIVDKGGLIRVGTALHEALVNAIEHGNLELPSALRDQDERRPYVALMEKRRSEPPYSLRRVHVRAQFSHDRAVFIIRDDGPGFDHSTLPDPTDPSNLEKVSGRGLYLIRNFMDEVHFNATGNEITLIKRRR